MTSTLYCHTICQKWGTVLTTPSLVSRTSGPDKKQTDMKKGQPWRHHAIVTYLPWQAMYFFGFEPSALWNVNTSTHLWRNESTKACVVWLSRLELYRNKVCVDVSRWRFAFTLKLNDGRVIYTFNNYKIKITALCCNLIFENGVSVFNAYIHVHVSTLQGLHMYS